MDKLATANARPENIITTPTEFQGAAKLPLVSKLGSSLPEVCALTDLRMTKVQTTVESDLETESLHLKPTLRPWGGFNRRALLLPQTLAMSPHGA